MLLSQVPLSRADADGMAAADAEEEDAAADPAAEAAAQASDSEGEEPRVEPKKKVHPKPSKASHPLKRCLVNGLSHPDLE